MLVVMGIALAFNLLIILWKFANDRAVDGLIDATLLGLIALFFSGSFDALAVGTVASAIVSIYLLISPPFKEEVT